MDALRERVAGELRKAAKTWQSEEDTTTALVEQFAKWLDDVAGEDLQYTPPAAQLAYRVAIRHAAVRVREEV